MKIIKGSITVLASEGHITLQVPDIAISLGKTVEYEDVPDDWLCRINSHHLALYKSGFLYLTRKGFEVNKDKIRNAFEIAISGKWNRGQNWQDFLDYVENHFKKVEYFRNKDINKIKKQLEKLENFVP